MTWTTPRTWVTGEIVTSANMNTHVRDNLLETAPAKAAAEGDTFYATAANALAVLTKAAADGALMQQASGLPAWLAKGAALEGLRMNAGGTAPEWANVTATLDKSHSTVDVTTTSETSIWSKSIGAGVIGANNGIRATLAGDMTKDADGSTITLRIKLGATTVFTSPAFAPLTSANRRKWLLEIFCLNQGSESSQVWAVRLTLTDDTADDFTVTVATDVWLGGAVGTSAEDTSSAKTLAVTVEQSGGSTRSWRKEMALLERLA